MIKPILKDFGELLENTDQNELYKLIRNGELESIATGLKELCDCHQGFKKHLEGDVAIHSILVVKNLIEIGKQHPEIQINEIDYLAALIHDIEKPKVRIEIEGEIKFPGHEELAAKRVPGIALNLNLSKQQEEKLYYLVANHGNCLIMLEDSQSWENLEYWSNLKALQKADALSCWLTFDGSKNYQNTGKILKRLNCD